MVICKKKITNREQLYYNSAQKSGVFLAVPAGLGEGLMENCGTFHRSVYEKLQCN